jgi:hypothetical protein
MLAALVLDGRLLPTVDSNANSSAMSDALAWSFDAIAGIAWLEVIKALAPVATAVIAFLALRNWQRQDKAKRQAEFLDELIETTHAYITEMARPTALVEMARIGMKCHSPKWEDDDDRVSVAEGAVPYIQKNGERDAKRLLEALNEVRPATIRLRSLGTKGQVFRFKDYGNCQKAVAMLTWEFDRIEAFASIVGSPTLNWEHPEVQRSLQGILTVAPADVRKHLGDNNVAVLEFAQEIYRQMYG